MNLRNFVIIMESRDFFSNKDSTTNGIVERNNIIVLDY
jgi:hypothetical protein